MRSESLSRSIRRLNGHGSGITSATLQNPDRMSPFQIPIWPAIENGISAKILAGLAIDGGIWTPTFGKKFGPFGAWTETILDPVPNKAMAG